MDKMTNRGQITVLVLLLGLLGLTASLSMASRSLSDIKQVTQVDAGTKALAAAETALQYGLSKLPTITLPDPGEQVTTTIPPTEISIPNIKSLEYTVRSPSSLTAKIENIAKDDVGQLDVTTINTSAKRLNIFWQQGSLEVIIRDKNDVIRRFGINPPGSTQTNGFSGGYAYSDTSNCPSLCSVPAGYSYCSGELIPVDRNNDRLLRIKPIYTSSSVIVCTLNAGQSRAYDMPLDYLEIEAKAVTTNDTVKKVQAIKYPAAMPSLFDYVLYSGGGISK